MVYYTGFGELIDLVRTKNDLKDLTFKEIHDPTNGKYALTEVDLFIIGPSAINSIKVVQKIVSIDPRLSILILAYPKDFAAIKQSLSFSSFVGKSTICISFSPQIELAPIFKDAITRTKQRRSFQTFHANERTKSIFLGDRTLNVKRLGGLLDHAPMGVLLINSEGKIVSANSFAKNIFKILSANTVVDFSMLVPRSLKSILERSEANLAAGTRSRIELLDKTLEYSCSSVFEEDGQTFVLFLFNDVTEISEQDKRVYAILESLPQMAWDRSRWKSGLYE